MTDPAPLTAALELDIRELAGAKPGELAQRLIERGWTRDRSTPSVDGLREALLVVERQSRIHRLVVLDIIERALAATPTPAPGWERLPDGGVRIPWPDESPTPSVDRVCYEKHHGWTEPHDRYRCSTPSVDGLREALLAELYGLTGEVEEPGEVLVRIEEAAAAVSSRLDRALVATPTPAPAPADPLAAKDRSMAEHSDTRSECPTCGEWRDSPYSDCASCGRAALSDSSAGVEG